MELTVLERLVVQALLPKEGNYTTLKLLRVCREALSFDDLENKRLDFKQEGEGETAQVRWNEKVGDEIVKNIEFGEVMKLEIIASLKKLEEEKKLRDEHFTIYEKFVEKPKNTVELVT